MRSCGRSRGGGFDRSYAARREKRQARVVGDPERSIDDADQLIQQVMRERGYPGENLEQRPADLSVDAVRWAA